MYRLNKPIHSSWLIAVASVAMLSGMYISSEIPELELHSVAWLFTAIALIISSLVHQKIWVIPMVICGGMLLGIWRMDGMLYSMSTLDDVYGKTVTIQGIVSEDPDVDTRGRTLLRIKDSFINDESVGGVVWLSLASTNSDIKRSDIVVVNGVLSEGFGSFVASVYRAKFISLQRPEPGDVALKIRDRFSSAIRSVIPEPQSSLGVGYLLGQRRSLPPDLDSALQIAGLTHVVVASGYNLTILVRFARRLFEGVSKYLSAVTSGAMILCFISITGMSPSMSRAGLVAGLALLAWYYGRSFNPVVLLAFAAGLTAFINPSYLLGDIGWQLSFAAFGGVMILAPLLQSYYFGDTQPGTIRQILGETISAWICTLPILILTFGKVSLVAVLANILILPLVPLAMLMVFASGVATLIGGGLANMLSFPTMLLLTYMTEIAFNLANVSWAQIDVTIAPIQAVIMYVGILGFTIFLWRRTKLSLRDTSIIE